MSAYLFYPLALAAIISALGVVATNNPVRSALSLVVTLFFLAISYVLLEAHLVAGLQIIVYAGAVMVLFLFVITLLNLQPDPLDTGRGVLTVVAAVAGVALATGLGTALYASEAARGVAETMPEGFGTTAVLARSMFYDHIVAFELTSILLLVAVVGAVVLAKRDPAPGPTGRTTEL